MAFGFHQIQRFIEFSNSVSVMLLVPAVYAVPFRLAFRADEGDQVLAFALEAQNLGVILRKEPDWDRRPISIWMAGVPIEDAVFHDFLPRPSVNRRPFAHFPRLQWKPKQRRYFCMVNEFPKYPKTNSPHL